MSEPVFVSLASLVKSKQGQGPNKDWLVFWAHWGTFRKYTAPILNSVYVQQAENKTWENSSINMLDLHKASQKSSAKERIKHQ